MSTTTSNLELIKQSVTDNVNVESLNANFDILDSEISALKADYVLSSGVEKINNVEWTYRRWNSGVMECWGNTENFNATYSSWGDSAYFNKEYVFPYQFAKAPVVNATVMSVGHLAWVSYHDITTKAVTIYVSTLTGHVGTTYKVRLSMNIKGTWK